MCERWCVTCDKVVCDKVVCDKDVCERWCVTKFVCDKVVCDNFVCDKDVCVCDKVVCDKVVCVTKLCVTKLDVTKLDVTKLDVTMLCGSAVSEAEEVHAGCRSTRSPHLIVWGTKGPLDHWIQGYPVFRIFQTKPFQELCRLGGRAQRCYVVLPRAAWAPREHLDVFLVI